MMVHASRFIVLLIVFFATATRLFSQQKDVTIRVMQDQSTFLNDFQTTLKLQKKSFKFQIAFQNCDGVFVFASIRDSVYRFTENSPIQDFEYLKLLELKEIDYYNNNRELSISDIGWSYWFYSVNGEWGSFDRKVTHIDTDRTVCTKVIKQLYNVSDGKVIRIKDINTPLYLIFIAVADYDPSGRPSKELMRRKLKIEWADED